LIGLQTGRSIVDVAQPADVPRLLPRFYRFQQREEERKLARILLESGGEDPPATNGKPLTRSADGHDPERLRGLPAIGRNVSGAIRGTDPVGALLRSENGRRRR
jgi:hypothetical protein